jgi:purine catabolism regulator
MGLTLERVVRLAELELRVLTADPSLDRPLRWVAVSEQSDPTPWIESGDLVLTTGMSLSALAEECEGYISRLVLAEAAGLGFGVGLHHSCVPAALIEAAERAGLPLIEVPEPVPFVAVSRAVSRLLAAEEYAESGASFDSQRRMIRAVLSEGGEGIDDASLPVVASRVLPVLARHVRGIALLLEPGGDVDFCVPASAASRASEFTGEIDRLRPRGLLASASLSTVDEHIVIVPVGVRESVRGFLVLGSPGPLTSADQAVLNLAVSLLSWESTAMARAERDLDRWRSLLIDVARVEGLTVPRLTELGITGLDPARGVAVAVQARSGALLIIPSSPGTILCSDDQGGIIGLAGVDADGRSPSVLRLLAAREDVRSVGISEVLDLTRPADVRQALAQAQEAADAGVGWSPHGELRSRSVESLVEASTMQAWARAYLQPLLLTAEDAELRETLEAWLAHHGQVDATAQRLGIHRHTVRHRLRRIEGVLGASLEDPSVRADLWFALRAVLPSSSPLVRSEPADGDARE